jgi:hypothetical protein
MASIVDVATQLMAQNTYTTSQSLPAINVHPGKLATTFVTINLQTPPAASATFALEIAATPNGTYSEIGRLVWPAGLSGSKTVEVGVNAALAQRLNNQAAWMRLSLTTSGPLTGSAWLSKPSDGGPGLGSRSYSLDNVNAF